MWISADDLGEHSAASEYVLGRQYCSGNTDVKSSSSTEVLKVYNVVSYCPKKLKVYFHFPLVLVFTNSNKKVLSLLMDIFPLNNYPNFF